MTWTLRSSLPRIIERWPWLAALVLLGAVLGWSAARLAPPQYRAAAELYVGLHAYRAPDENKRNPSSYYDFRNLDDFKNWQLEQLDQFVRRDAVLAETLARLQAQDPAWQAFTLTDLQAMLAPQWRTVGKWQLVATAPSARLAEQAATTWRAVTLEMLADALHSAAEVMRLDVEMQAVAARQSDLTRRAALLEHARLGLLAWQTQVQALPESDSLPQILRWRLQGLAAQASAFTPGWQALLAQPPGDSRRAALSWSAEVLAALEADLQALPAQQAALQARFEALDAQYRAANAASQGLSRNLSLDGLSSQPVQAQAVRAAGAWALTGALLGLLGAVLAWLLLLGGWDD